MVFRARQRDPRTWDVARLSESVKFYAFRNSRNIPRARITLSCTESHLVFLYDEIYVTYHVYHGALHVLPRPSCLVALCEHPLLSFEFYTFCTLKCSVLNKIFDQKYQLTNIDLTICFEKRGKNNVNQGNSLYVFTQLINW